MAKNENENEQVVKPDFWAVALDVTSYYSIDPKHAPYVKAIKDVFMYDRSTRTFCCEATPSYHLIHLHTFCELNEVEGLTEELRDQIDQTYCYVPTDDCYMHCSTVEGCKEQVQYDATGKEEQSEDGEEPMAYWQGNYPF